MPTRTLPDERLRVLNDLPPAEGDRVVYWMQQSQRAEDNPALERAVRWANDLGVGLVVAFGLTDRYPEANLRHYRFMLEGLAETSRSLARRGIPLVVRLGDPPEVAIELAEKASVLVCDRGYLRHQKAWRREVTSEAHCRVEEVEGDVVVPVEVASDKREWAARTLRPKLHRHMGDFLVEPSTTPLESDSTGLADGLRGLDLSGSASGSGDPDGPAPSGVDEILDGLDVDRSVPPVSALFPGGASEAKRRLRTFIEARLKRYDGRRSRPDDEAVSELSPYLHFGQISPVRVAFEVANTRYGKKEDREAFLEELVVRRELAVNYVHFEPDYDRYEALPDWARTTLDEHRDDPREHLYTLDELEAAETHDPWWNAAQREMAHTGYMHNHMRMYWGKRILAWSPGPEEAYRRTLHLNNKYLLDGRDCSSFANVAWLFGLHDRAWGEREVFGKVRIMTRSGLERKIDPEAYAERVERRIEVLGDGVS